MNPDQEYALTAGGEITLHSHPTVITQDMLHRLDTIAKTPTVTGDTTLTGSEDYVVVDTSLGNVTITLPRNIPGLVSEIMKPFSSNTIIVLPQSGATILGYAGATITAAGAALRFKLFGMDWKLI